MLLPGTVPGAVQVVNASLPVLTLAAEWRRVDWRGVGYALIGRLPGSLLGGLVVVYVSTRTLGLLVAVMVMVAVVLTARSVAVPRTGGTLTAAGFLSGVTGTATGIGGPPAEGPGRAGDRGVRTRPLHLLLGVRHSVLGQR